MKSFFVAVMMGVMCVVPSVYAEESSNVSLPDPGILPTSSFYWIDVLSEQWQLWTTSDAKRPALLQKFMNEKLAEVVATIDHEKSAAQAGERFEQYFSDLEKTVGKSDIAPTYASLIDATVTNLNVLSNTVSTSGAAETPAFVNEMITAMSNAHQSFLSTLSSTDQSSAASTLLSQVEQLPTDQLSVSAQQVINQFVHSVFDWIAEFFKDRYAQLSAQAQTYLKAQANTYIDSVKADLILGIQSIKIP